MFLVIAPIKYLFLRHVCRSTGAGNYLQMSPIVTLVLASGRTLSYILPID